MTTPFAAPLIVALTSSHGEPVAGGTVTFTVNPVGGAGATLTGNPAMTNGSGQASVTATANGTAGNYIRHGGGEWCDRHADLPPDECAGGAGGE